MGLTTEEPISLVESSEIGAAPKEPRAASNQVAVPPAEKLKSELRSLLRRHHGLTNHPDVVSVIDKLSKLNPCEKDCAQSPDFLGTFCALTAPSFPGRIETQPGHEDIVQYTLGRLSFNLFQPGNLVCTLRSVHNPIVRKETSKDGKDSFSYNLVSDIVIHTDDGDLPARLVSEAYCYENKNVNNRMMVSFTGGTLIPSPEEDFETFNEDLWSKTFEGAYSRADKERSVFGWIFRYFLTFLLGLTLPTDEAYSKHSFHFDMKRSPVGHLDVIYLDKDMRITKGNRGTLVVVERSESTGLPSQ